jgi:hypothetical protein
MFNLLLVACFTAFFLALLDLLIEVLSAFVGAVAVNAAVSMFFSVIGTYLVSSYTLKGFLIRAVAGAFLGKVLIKSAELLASYRPIIVNQSRQ